MTSKYVMDAFRLVRKLRYRYDISTDNGLTPYQKWERSNMLNRICGTFNYCGWSNGLDQNSQWSQTANEWYRVQQRKKRCRRYLREMFAAHSLHPKQFFFITFTFNDNTLHNTNADTRKQHVLRWCKKNLIDYWGNIDFGSQSQREHYHIAAYAPPEYVKASARPTSSFGHIDWKPIRLNNKSAAKLGNYINKLANHATKETTGKGFHARGAIGHKPVKRESGLLYEVEDLPF